MPRTKRVLQAAARGLRIAGAAVVAGAAFGTWCGFAGRAWWVLDLASHFRVQYLWILAAGACVLLWKRWRRAAGLAFGCAAANAVVIAPLYLSAAPSAASQGGASCRIVSLNVMARNYQYDRVLEFVRESSADVVFLCETTDRWERALAPLEREYPYHLKTVGYPNWDLSLFSRLPLESSGREEIGEGGSIPCLRATVRVNGQPVTILGAHLFPPRSGRSSRARDSQFAGLLRLASRQERTVLVGDLNVTSWSAVFRDRVPASGMIDSRRGFGVQASWPAAAPFAAIPIDHCLVSRDIAVTSRSLGPNVGSDHRPVIVDLSVAEAPPNPSSEER